MAFGINVKELTAELNAKFDQLLAKLDELLVELKRANANGG